MSSTEPKPQRADARRNRERIVDAARELFAECGQTTQMDDVARRAQVGVGTVYRHFPTKTALLGELMGAKFRHHAIVARRWAEQEPDGWAAFEGFLRDAFSSIAQDATLQQRAIWVDDSEILALAEGERRIVTELVGELIARAHEEGTLRADFTADDIPAVMCSVGSVFAAQGRLPLRADRFVELIIDGLRAPAA